jgi:NitT/TauT family transport system substrate-binding protein
MKRISTTIAAAITAAAVVIAPHAASAKDKITIVMSSWGVLYWPTLAAEQLGYFADEGIETEMIRTGGGTKSLAAVAGGDAQVNVGSPASAFRAHAKGSDVIVIAPSIAQYADNLVMTAAWAKKNNLTDSSSYQDKLKALKGMTIAVASIGAGSSQLLQLLSKEAGLDMQRDLTMTAMSTGENIIAALGQNRIDGFIFPSPVSDEAIKNHGAKMMIHTAAGEVKQLDGFVYIGLVVRKSWVQAHPDLTVRILKAEQRALDAIHNPQLTNKARDLIAAKYSPKTDKALFDQVWKTAIPSFPKTVEVNRKMMERIVNFVNEYQSGDPLNKSVLDTAWTNEYSEKALAALGKKK